MDDAKRELVRAWLIKASHDHDAARLLGSARDGHLDIAIYHCQQAAEKAIKGFLAFHDHDLQRTHDLRRLVQVALSYEPGFSGQLDAAITLTPYATAYRYPGEAGTLEPSRAEFEEALNLAAEAVTFVCSVLPSEVHPDK